MTDRDKLLIRNSTADFLMFTGQAGERSIEARFQDGTIWLSQKLMAELFAVDVRTISEYIFSISELNEEVRATLFRQWATRVLWVYAIKSYVLDRKRNFDRILKQISP